MADPAPLVPGYRPGEPAYRRITIALFLAGLATFALLYTPQPLLPELAAQFDLDPATATLSLSVATLGLGFALLLAGPATEVLGRTPLMNFSLFSASLVGLACALAGSWELLLVLRATQGVVLAGLPAVATAYLREEIDSSASSAAIGLYIGGTALGSMFGRLLGGFLTELLGWRAAFAGLGVLGLVCAVTVLLILPGSRNFRPTARNPREILRTFWRALTDPALLALYGISGALMGGFVAVYNVMAFRLVAAPYALPLGIASLVFITYAVGGWSSSYAGRLADRFGHRAVVPVAIGVCLIGLLITLAVPLPVVVVGLALLTAGFFAAHGAASSWVASRAVAGGRGAGQAASLYLFVYYLGSSIFGSLAGVAWSRAEWPGVAAMVGVLWLAAMGLALLLRRVPRLDR